MRGCRVPQARLFDRDHDAAPRFSAGGDRDTACGRRRGIRDRYGQCRLSRNIGGHGVFRNDQCRAVVLELRFHKDVPRLHAHTSARPQEHIAIHTGTGIPSGGRLEALGFKLELVRMSAPDPVRNVEQIRRISVRMDNELIVVYTHRGEHIRAVHIEDHMLRILRKGHIFEIPSGAAGIKAVRAAARCMGIAFLGYRIVVRQIHRDKAVRAGRGEEPVLRDTNFLHRVFSL